MIDRPGLDRRRELAEALRARWRLFERVVLRPGAGGQGLHATIHLDPVIVRGAAEQQGTNRSPALTARAAERRRRAIAACVEGFNEDLPQAERIGGFDVIGD